MIHRPMPNDHCTCGKYMAGDWGGHEADLLVLDPEAETNPKRLSNLEFAFRPFVERYINSVREIGKALAKMTESLNAVDMKKIERLAKPVDLRVPDIELPGMWTYSDFEGGDPDERSYAQRCRDGDHLFTNFRDLSPQGQHTKCVNCGMRLGG